jgi:hypothetical protein
VSSAIAAGVLGHAASGCLILGFDFDKDPPNGAGGAAAATTTEAASSSSAGGCSGSNGDDYRTIVVSDGPIAYWRLGEPSGVQAEDEVGDHTGAYTGNLMLDATGAVAGNSAVAFTEGSVELGDVLDLATGGAFSVEAWIKPEFLDTEYRRIVAKRGGEGDAGQGYSLFMHQDQGISFETYRDGANLTTSCPPAGGRHCAPLGQFSHVVGTYDTTTIRLYVNGIQVGFKTGTIALADHDGPLVIGAWSMGGNFWKGSIDEVAIYDDALPVGRVEEHHRVGVECR